MVYQLIDVVLLLNCFWDVISRCFSYDKISLMMTLGFFNVFIVAVLVPLSMVCIFCCAFSYNFFILLWFLKWETLSLLNFFLLILSISFLWTFFMLLFCCHSSFICCWNWQTSMSCHSHFLRVCTISPLNSFVIVSGNANDSLIWVWLPKIQTL